MSMLERRVARLETVIHGSERLIIVIADEEVETRHALTIRGIAEAPVDLVVRVRFVGAEPGKPTKIERVTIDGLEMPALH